ncbi:MAG TPA: bifunctional aspartate kinase/homoserine dehydrogenase I [bacterium]|nr:bifunctional aspartate kinase/homoserine dehydrogenase I [bacterium]HPN42216.1 bifunctional aspartate kinase/homoserine dehydrogenase I [bacterium]
MLRVLKFGGSSLATAERVNNVANIVTGDYSGKEPLILVLSAVGGITDQLILAARTAEAQGAKALEIVSAIKQRHNNVFAAQLEDAKINTEITATFTELEDIIKGVSLVRECSLRTLDLVESFGERLCNRLMSVLLVQRGFKAEFVDSRELVLTDRRHGGARVDFEETYKRIKKRIKENKIYVVTGFIGATQDNVTTTLGRGGSDYSAAIFGAAMDVDKIEIWTDVDGFMSADPRMVTNAFVLPRVSYEEAMELSYFGAKVIHPQTLVPAIKKNITILIKNSFSPANPGTIISPEKGDFEHPVKGIASFHGISMLNIQGSGMVGVPGIAGRLFSALAAKSINVIMITQASSEHSISLAVLSSEAESAKETIETEFSTEILAGIIDQVETTNNLAIIAAVGENMAGKPGISGKLFGALGQNSINIKAIAQGSGERNVSLVVNSSQADKAVNVMHSAFYLSNRVANLFIVGVGGIGATLLKQIQNKQKELAEQNNLIINICGIANSKKMIFAEKGLDLTRWRDMLTTATETFKISELIAKIKQFELANTILVDVTASDEIAGYYEKIISAGIHVVTPNKKANTMGQDYYDRIKNLIRDHRLHYLYETTVGAGLPLIGTIINLKNSGDNIYKIEGILSGTMSYLFNTMSHNRPFSAVVREAHQKGYTEPDPRDDLSGMDVGRKLLILAREIGLRMELADIKVQSLIPAAMERIPLEEFWQKLPSLDENFENQRLKAEKQGQVLRYIAKLDDKGCRVSVENVPQGTALALSGATDNIIQITTERYSENPLIIQGPGAGREVTAGGVFADIITLCFHLT